MNKLLRNIIGDTNNNQHRAALANNAKVFNGTTSYNTVNGFTQFEITQPITYMFVTSNNNDGWFSTRQLATNAKGMLLFNTGVLMSKTNDPAGRLSFFATAPLKTGRNITIISYDGSQTFAGARAYINGRLSPLGSTQNNTQGGSIITALANANVQYDANFAPSGQYAAATNVRKFQIINRVATVAEVREAFNLGTFEGVVLDANFLLDIDFNKTGTDAPTTRAGTPTYTISNVGTTSYASYY